MRIKRLIVRILLGAVAVVAPVAAGAQYPEGPITVVVPNNPGGSTDRVARLFSDAIQEGLNVPVTVTNMPGGGTSVGARFVMESPADGQTVLMVHQALMTAGATGISDFGAEAFEPVAITGVDPSIIIVRADSEYATLTDLMETIAERPGEVTAGVNIGALNHFALMAVEAAAGGGFRFVHTGGGGPSTTALLGGHIDATYLTLSDAMQYHESGDLRILAVFLPERHVAAPDLPTAVEQGYDLVLPIKHIWWMPVGTPEDRVAAFAAALEAAMVDPRIEQTFAESLTVPRFVQGEELDEEVQSEYARIQEMAATADLEPSAN